MKKFSMAILGSLVLPGTLFGYVLLRYHRHCKRASRFYERAEQLFALPV